MATKSDRLPNSLELLLPAAVIILPVAWVWHMLRPPRIPGIEALPDNSHFGHSLNSGTDITKLHELQLERAKKHGPVFQYRYYGHNIVVFNDMLLAKIAFREVTGKGALISM